MSAPHIALPKPAHTRRILTLRDLPDVLGSWPMGLHLDSAPAGSRRVFDRVHTGYPGDSSDTSALVEAAFAEWDFPDNSRNAIVVYFSGYPQLVFAHADFARSPGQNADGRLRFIATAIVHDLRRADACYQLTTGPTSDGRIRAMLTPHSTGVSRRDGVFLRNLAITHRRGHVPGSSPVDGMADCRGAAS